MEMNKYPLPLRSLKAIYRFKVKSKIKYWFWGITFLFAAILFLPWTQNIKATGIVTALLQNQRPQKIHSPIPGRIVKWWIKEGDIVKKGDTVLQLSEIKEDYLDPNLVKQTQKQVDAKKGSVAFYQNKMNTASTQIDALNASKKLKLQQLNNKILQLENKLSGERAELFATDNEVALAQDQYSRQEKMFEEGLVSQTQLQQRNALYQNTVSKKIVIENKLSQTQQEVKNVIIERNSIEQEYIEKISKIEGDRFQTLSNIATSDGEIAKLENIVSNYIIRNSMYYILAPQDGQIVQANKTGIGEILKEGESITMIVPDKMNYAVEMFIRPADLPLISEGQRVRFMFDGYPAIVFSGWPKGSYGTFGGRVKVIENTISSNGMFRLLIAEDSLDRKWPEQLKIGTGVQCIALLKDVAIWYEVWRNINGFPPDYYYNNKIKTEKKYDTKN